MLLCRILRQRSSCTSFSSIVMQLLDWQKMQMQWLPRPQYHPVTAWLLSGNSAYRLPSPNCCLVKGLVNITDALHLKYEVLLFSSVQPCFARLIINAGTNPHQMEVFSGGC